MIFNGSFVLILMWRRDRFFFSMFFFKVEHLLVFNSKLCETYKFDNYFVFVIPKGR